MSDNIDMTVDDEETLIKTITESLADGSEITSADLQAVERFLGDDTMTQIPFLDRDFLKSFHQVQPKLVRYVGMVQNLLDPEYYESKVNGKSTHFRDMPVSSTSGDFIDDMQFPSDLAERHPVMVVPIPFASAWFMDLLANKFATANSTQVVQIPPSPEAVDVSSSARKRGREGDDNEECCMSNDNRRHVKFDRPDCESIEEHVQVQGQETDWWPAGCMGSPNHLCPTLAKVYYDQHSEAKSSKRRLRVNDLVEMIGVLSMDPWEADTAVETGGFCDVCPPPPPSRLPRLHVLAYDIVDLDALVTKNDTQGRDGEKTGNISQTDMADQRRTLLQHMENVTRDAILAESLCMTLLSKAIRERHGHGGESFAIKRLSNQAIGCASLHITTSLESSEDMYNALSNVLKTICPVVACVDLWGKNLHPFPCKINGQMIPSPWQLPKGSILLIHIDGSNNEELLSAVDSLVSQHQIPYTFDEFMKLAFDADYRIIVISPRSTRIACTLKYEHQGARMPATTNKKDLSTIRNALSDCVKVTADVKLPQEVLMRAQEDFLSRRRRGGGGAAAAAGTTQTLNGSSKIPNEMDFHRWLTLCRLQSRSRKSDVATLQDWKSGLALDDAISTSRMEQ